MIMFILIIVSTKLIIVTNVDDLLILLNTFFSFFFHFQSPSSTGDGDAGQNVDVRCSLVDVAEDYTKRKHVLRVANPNAEVLLQTEDAASMALWLRAMHKHAAVEKSSVGVRLDHYKLI